jgi:glutamate/tyrosine decarboxylase-like PLP-dependent enzyme
MDAVRLIEADETFRLRPDRVRDAIATDRRAGFEPFLIVATAGTTSSGVVDPLPELADLAEAEGLWLHTDAAWGGAAVLVPELRSALSGIDRSDSITFDAHKWLSVPMGAALYLTRDPRILTDTFQVRTAYMPKEAASLDVIDPHLHSMQWSRRFIGLKVFLSLLVAGWVGYEEAIRHQTAMGDLLRGELTAAGWKIVNQTSLPVVCFIDPNGDAERQRSIALEVVRSGQAWISPTVVGGQAVIRACVTHYGTTPADVKALVEALGRARNH